MTDPYLKAVFKHAQQWLNLDSVLTGLLALSAQEDHEKTIESFSDNLLRLRSESSFQTMIGTLVDTARKLGTNFIEGPYDGLSPSMSTDLDLLARLGGDSETHRAAVDYAGGSLDGNQMIYITV